ncbi:MAG: aspartate aminotransferase family protein [Chloroflexi bacterium]|nr:aspartate aminotransferase family protein [Chloroflexota bacterium]
MTTTSIIDLESTHTSGVYPKRPVAIVRGQGARVWDADGREYIDCVAGQGAANLGHSHPAIVRAIHEQAERLITCPEIFYNDRRAELLAALTEVAPGDLNRAFLCNSGAEAVEAAIKFARLSTGRTRIVAAKQGFHGRTMGALSATWSPKYRRPFQPLVPDFVHVPFNDADALAEAVNEQTAAVLLEVVQGEGGVHPAEREYLAAARTLCQESGALLIFDEVQTGYGRTGKMFACEHVGVEPDLMAIAKSMAGGFPMGACLIGPRVGELARMTHGSTFGGNPLACAAALATLRVMEQEQLAERAARLGAWLLERLKGIDSRMIREVRGLGLMIGIDLRVKVTPILKALHERGVLALPAGPTVLRLLPPLVISEDDLARVADTIEETISG